METRRGRTLRSSTSVKRVSAPSKESGEDPRAPLPFVAQAAPSSDESAKDTKAPPAFVAQAKPKNMGAKNAKAPPPFLAQATPVSVSTSNAEVLPAVAAPTAPTFVARAVPAPRSFKNAKTPPAFVAQTAPTQIPLESPGKPPLNITTVPPRLRTPAPTARLNMELKRAPPFVKKVAKPIDNPLGTEDNALQPAKAPMGMPRFPMKNSITTVQERNKENPAPSRRMNLTASNSPSGSSMKTMVMATVTSKLGNPSLSSTTLGNPRQDAGSLFKGNFGKSVFSAKQSNRAGIGLKTLGFLSVGASSTPNKKRTLTQFQSEKNSSTSKTAQPQPAFSLKPPLQAKMQSSKTLMLFSRTDNSAKTQSSSFSITKSGSRPFALTPGKGPSGMVPLPNETQKKALEDYKMLSKTTPLAKKSTTLRVAAPALVSPSNNSPYQRTAQVKLMRRGVSPHVIPLTGEDDARRELEPRLKKFKPDTFELSRPPSDDPRQRFDPSQEDDAAEFDVDQIDAACDDDVVQRVKSVQDFIDEVSKEQSLGASRILDMDVTLSECLLDIVTDLIAEEGGIGLHKVCKDAEVDSELLAKMMECHGVDEY